ncbi:MAG TPA: hypothetical protein ENJ49_00325 [Candidatus Moranbacteria bacterium]|nr:hypothetical protein [Candidatus Moranbacteria bacterium]
MVFQRKIEEIRQKPEHQRIRYVWLMVSICMFFLIIVWFFSVKDELSGGFLKNNNTLSNGDMMKSLNADKTNVEDKNNR